MNVRRIVDQDERLWHWLGSGDYYDSGVNTVVDVIPPKFLGIYLNEIFHSSVFNLSKVASDLDDDVGTRQNDGPSVDDHLDRHIRAADG